MTTPKAGGKLIRDRMPEFYGQHGQYRRLNDTEYEAALCQKLQEEVSEYLESGEALELADILEVIDALAALQGISTSELDALQQQKRQQRGGFEQRLWWNGEADGLELHLTPTLEP